jgi:hypothetical protein
MLVFLGVSAPRKPAREGAGDHLATILMLGSSPFQLSSKCCADMSTSASAADAIIVARKEAPRYPTIWP